MKPEEIIGALTGQLILKPLENPMVDEPPPIYEKAPPRPPLRTDLRVTFAPHVAHALSAVETAPAPEKE